MLGRTNAGGSGSGGTLTVTGVAGDTVTVSKDGKTYSKTFKDDGTATFKGLKTGTWTATMTDGASTASRTVEISADYELTMTYFSATINVTYPEGSTCTATDGTTTLTAPDTSGTWACVVPNAGTWTVTATNGEQTKSTTVSITAEGQVEKVMLSYELYLLKDGVLATIDGTQSSLEKLSGKSSPVLTNGIIKSSVGDSTASSFRFTPAIDISGYSTLTFTYTFSLQFTKKGIKFGVMSTDHVLGTFDSKSTFYPYTKITKSATDYITVEVDISECNGTMYVGVEAFGIYTIKEVLLK